MGLFWNKKIQSNKIIYTRTKQQKRWLYIILLIAFLFIIVPIFIPILPIYRGYSIMIGFTIIIFLVIFGSYVNFLLLFAKIRNKKFEIKILSDGNDQVIIEK